MIMIMLQCHLQGNKDDIEQVRKVLDENGGKDIKIITKVENVEGPRKYGRNCRKC